MPSDRSDKYFVFSYNFQSDRFFVEWLSQQLRERGIPNWHLDDFDADAVQRTLAVSQRDTRYSEDWRLKARNWQATYLHHVQHAQGVVVVHGSEGRASAFTLGRGMWREADAVEYIRQDNPMRVKTVENPTPYQIPAGESAVDVVGLVAWAKEVLTLPPVRRPEVTDDQPAAFNRKIDAAEALQLPEQKTRVTDWYELVRLDLYDVMWFCRRCSVESDNYILGTELPPRECPICEFKGYESDYCGAGASAEREGNKPSFKDKRAARTFYAGMVRTAEQAISLSEQALELQKRGQYDQAMELNVQLERLCRQLGLLEELAAALGDQAMLLHQRDGLDVAVELYGHAERICREIGDKSHLQRYLGNLATILDAFGRFDLAMDRYEEQERICRALRNSNSLEMALGNQARTLIKLKRFDRAMELLKEQETICRSLKKDDGLKVSLTLQAEILERTSEQSENRGGSL